MTHRPYRRPMKLAMMLAAAIALGATAGAGCSRGGDVTPRQQAYPRAAVYDSAYTAVDSAGVTIMANSAATVTCPRHRWLDIAYPAYKATIHITVTEAAEPNDYAATIANRHERMRLNIGDAEAAVLQYAGADSSWRCEVVVCAEPIATPLQFVAHDGRRIVSGATFFADITPATDADSIAPMLATLRRDVIVMLKSLR
ncbi:MAG: hypothetical protein ACI306_06640 [Muribaculaceae bacterium]